MPNDGQPGSVSCKNKIGERDGWICGICQKAIDPSLSVYSSIWAAVTDHRVARSAGGGDDDDNLQIAHYECNRTKHSVGQEVTPRLVRCGRCGEVWLSRAADRSSPPCPGCGISVMVRPNLVRNS